MFCCSCFDFASFPQDQKIPKPKRLQEWYKKMLDKGIIERIVLDYKDIYKQALEDNLQSAAELPYFEGDFWPNVMEENIREQEQVRRVVQFQRKREGQTENCCLLVAPAAFQRGSGRSRWQRWSQLLPYVLNKPKYYLSKG